MISSVRLCFFVEHIAHYCFLVERIAHLCFLVQCIAHAYPHCFLLMCLLLVAFGLSHTHTKTSLMLFFLEQCAETYQVRFPDYKNISPVSQLTTSQWSYTSDASSVLLLRPVCFQVRFPDYKNISPVSQLITSQWRYTSDASPVIS